ncbi:hypothetical protein [Paraburkholderia acidipaludis]|uniref:hypothetical protein n=1 Tax=Paraburkholderia acidipaludis TaxID=660537 RepID=UPI000693F2F6|nr:hypothetical protein [Paraburkholderia acidipaludis]
MDKISKTLTTLSSHAAAVTSRLSCVAAGALVMQAFVDVTLPALTASQAAGIHRQLQQRLEDTMALMDDAQLTREYHAAYLDKTNELLRALDRRKAADV